MTTPMGMADYFALEAGEYLERLSGLVNGGAGGAADILRYARALRGSALMANQQHMARAAAGLEALARACREGSRAFDAATVTRFTGALAELRQLVSRASQGHEADAARAEALGQELEAFAGAPSPPARASRTSGPVRAEPNAGARAFAARESALVASALGQAGQALRTAPPAREALSGVLRRMQPLRGLAALSDLPPMPELLEGIERVIGELGHAPVPPAAAAELLESAAQALTRCARDVTESGRPAADAPEVLRFAERVLATFSPPGTTVNIQQIVAGGGGVVQQGQVPQSLGAGGLDQVELVGHGEYLSQAADELERAPTAAQKILRLFGIASSLRTLAGGSRQGGASRLADFAELAGDRIAGGLAISAPAAFAACLREAGAILRGSGDAAADAALGARLNGIIARLLALAPGAPAPQAAPAATQPPRQSPTPSAPPAVAGEYLEESADLPGSFVTYARLMRGGEPGQPDLAELVNGTRAPAPRPMAPAGATTPPDGSHARVMAAVVPPSPRVTPPPRLDAPSPPAAGAPVGAGAEVDISALCYRGAGALERAGAVRREIAALRGARRPMAEWQPLLEELLDLVDLASKDGP